MNAKQWTIGFLDTSLDNTYQIQVFEGALRKSEELGMNFIFFPGNRIKSQMNFEYQANILYKLAYTNKLDGLVVHTSAIWNIGDVNEQLQFVKSYCSIPVVSIGVKIPSLPAILIDNQTSVRSLMEHLIVDHGYRDFAVMSGPSWNNDNRERVAVIRDEFTRHNIILDENHFLIGNYRAKDAYAVASRLLKKSRNKLRAIVATNDTMALGVIDAVKEAGLSIPHDIAIIGFDDIEVSQYAMPPLTTVTRRIEQEGIIAVELLNKLLNHEHVEDVYLPTYPVIRQSCGCPVKNIYEADIKIESIRHSNTLESGFTGLKKTISEGNLTFSFEKIDLTAADILVDAFYTQITTTKENHFLITLNDLLIRNIEQGKDVGIWKKFILFIQDFTLSLELTKEQAAFVMRLANHALILTGEIIQRDLQFKQEKYEKWFDKLWAKGNALINKFDWENLKQIIISTVQEFQLELCYLSAWNPEIPDYKSAFLLIAYNNGKDLLAANETPVYDTLELIPDQYLTVNNRFSIIIEPLYYEHEQLGYMIMGINTYNYQIFDFLRGLVSNVLKGSRLIEAIKQYAQELEEKVRERTAALQEANKNLREEIRQRRIFEKELEASEKKLQSIIKAIPIPLLIAKIENGEILYANQFFYNTFRINKKKRRLGLFIKDYYVDIDNWYSIIEKIHSRQPPGDIEIGLIKEDKTMFRSLTYYQKLVFMGEDSILAAFYDLTERKQLEKEILEISERERRRIGQDLHDDLSQDLAGVSVMLSILTRRLVNRDIDELNYLSSISKIIDLAIIKTKNLSKGLYPVELKESSITVLLEALLRRIEQQYMLKGHINVKIDTENKLDESTALHLYRITQEAINNAVRHGDPKNITILFIHEAERIILSIQDDGIGLPDDTRTTGGMGLQIMKYRANMIGGELKIKSASGAGTTVSCTIKQ